MRFSLVSGLVTAVALADPTCAILQPADIVSDLNGLSSQVTALAGSAFQINFGSVVQWETLQAGPVSSLLTGLNSLITTLQNDNGRLLLTPPYSDKDAQHISDAFTDLVTAEIAFVTLLTSKAPELFIAKDVNRQLVDNLGDLGTNIQTYATSVAQVVPSKVTTITNSLKPLFFLLGVGVNAYKGVQIFS